MAPCAESPSRASWLQDNIRGWVLPSEWSPKRKSSFGSSSSSPFGSPFGSPVRREESSDSLDFSFEFADDLEQGKGPGPISSYTEPLAGRDCEERLVVKRSQNRDTYTLTTKKGETLLVARANSDSTRFDLFITRDGENLKAMGPTFTLYANQSRSQWLLESLRCEQCVSRGKRKCGSRVLAKISHYTETLGDGQAFCMDLELPDQCEDGRSVITCPICRGENDSTADTHQAPMELTTRRPRWNAKQNSLTLDFKGRCSQASAKNFQLEVPGSDPDGQGRGKEVKLLFGKVGENKFNLDYKFPLGMVQAFATSLTASYWK